MTSARTTTGRGRGDGAPSIVLAGLALALVILAVLPLAARQSDGIHEKDALQVIVYTPHNEQIRSEFGRAFAAWHRRVHGVPAEVVWNTPGGATDIRRILEANAEAALRDGRPIGGNADLVFGGGSYEFDQLKREVAIGEGANRRTGRVLEQAPLDRAWLDAIYGENRIGDSTLFDPDGFWFGAALSGFGIVFNRENLAELGLPEPTRWEHLADARLAGQVTLVNPAQSGSVTTALEAIIQHLGWTKGWQVIRRMAANARSVASSGPRVPLDVSSGDSLAGPCIDFYGRYQAQAIRDAGDPDRLGYVDPKGETVIDPDPIALLSNAPNREAAVRFIRFALSDEGQALWQFRAAKRPDGELGPAQFELRRIPIRRDFIARHHHEFIDDVDPFALASTVPDQDKNARAFIAPLFSALCADRRDELARAWRAIRTHPAYPSGKALVTAADVDDQGLKAMLEDFDAMPTVEGPDGAAHDVATRDGRASIRNGYLRGAWKGTGLWPSEANGTDALRNRFGAFFADKYARVAGERR